MESMQLGDKIELSNFNSLDRDKLLVIRKIVGNFVKNLQGKYSDFEKLNLHLGSIHESKHEIKGSLRINRKDYYSEVTDFNLFFDINSILSKLEGEIR